LIGAGARPFRVADATLDREPLRIVEVGQRRRESG
jgi:hypothetical protein